MKITSLQQFLDRWIDEPALTIAIERYEIPTEENFWQWREMYRVFKDERKKPPFALNDELDRIHNVFVSPDDPKMLCYYQNEEKGKRDIVTTIKFGRYLTQFYADHFDNEKVKQITAEHMFQVSPAELKFVPENDHDLAEKIYEEGPNSCMKKARGHLRSEIHPARAYPTNNCTIAYIEKGGRFTARTIVNLKTKRYARVYGDEAMLGPLLKKEGFTKSGDALNGCRLHRLRAHDKNQTADVGYETCLMPYIDGNYTRVKLDPKDDRYFVICGSGSSAGIYGAQNTSGLMNIRNPDIKACSHCGKKHHKDEMRQVHEGVACPTCFPLYFREATNRDGDVVLADLDDIIFIRGKYYTDRRAAENAGYQPSSRGWIPNTTETIQGSLRAIPASVACTINRTNGRTGASERKQVDVLDALSPRSNSFVTMTVYPTLEPEERYATYRNSYPAEAAAKHIDIVAMNSIAQLDPDDLVSPITIAAGLHRIYGTGYSAHADPLVLHIYNILGYMSMDEIEALEPIEPLQEQVA